MCRKTIDVPNRIVQSRVPVGSSRCTPRHAAEHVTEPVDMTAATTPDMPMWSSDECGPELYGTQSIDQSRSVA